MTILETIPIIEAPGNYLNFMLYGLAGAVICLVLAGLLCDNYKIGPAVLICFSAIGILIFLISLVLTITEPKVDTGRKRYIIRVDENTSINDIYENYKIIDHTKYTDVYTVEELEND